MRKKSKLNNPILAASSGDDTSEDLQAHRGSFNIAKPLLCIIGLGNPGKEYEHTRHNAGFELVDEISARLAVRFRRSLLSPYQFARVDAEQIAHIFQLSPHELSFSALILVKPLTFMNHSGKVLPHVFRKFGKSIQFAVAVDQMDLPVGSVRMKLKGGTAGHNGLKSIVSYLDKDFWPLYIGIGRPSSNETVISHVLGIPEPDEREVLNRSVQSLSTLILKVLVDPLEQVLQTINSSIEPVVHATANHQ